MKSSHAQTPLSQALTPGALHELPRGLACNYPHLSIQFDSAMTLSVTRQRDQVSDVLKPMECWITQSHIGASTQETEFPRINAVLHYHQYSLLEDNESLLFSRAAAVYSLSMARSYVRTPPSPPPPHTQPPQHRGVLPLHTGVLLSPARWARSALRVPRDEQRDERKRGKVPGSGHARGDAEEPGDSSGWTLFYR